MKPYPGLELLIFIVDISRGWCPLLLSQALSDALIPAGLLPPARVGTTRWTVRSSFIQYEMTEISSLDLHIALLLRDTAETSSSRHTILIYLL